MRSSDKCLLLALILALTSACSSDQLPERRAQANTSVASQENSIGVAAIVKSQIANIRYAPSRTANVLATVSKGDLLSLITPTPTGAWYQIRDKSGVKGWIHGNTIALLQTASAKQVQRPRLASPPVSGRSYVNVDGVRVPSPVFRETKPAGATARCRDGSYSFSQHHRGTCSWHGGVLRWF